MSYTECMKVEDITRDNDGKLPSYAWPGGYPMYYDGIDVIDNEPLTICSECANTDNEIKEGDIELIQGCINYENKNLHCELCQKKIEPAYGDD